jgi:hypothetical protein
VPVLEITPDMVGPNRTQLALAYLESIMLWPHDEGQRAEAMKTTTATFVRDAIVSVPAARQAVQSAEWLDWFGLAADAFPLRHVRQVAWQPFVHGFLTGELFGAAISEFINKGTMKLEYLKKELCSLNLKRVSKTEEFKIKRSTLESIWAIYKPVSPLWAAYVANLLRGDHVFPCRLDELPRFLGTAKSYQDQGLQVPLLRRNEKLLSADWLWRFPPGLPLPHFEFPQARNISRPD